MIQVDESLEKFYRKRGQGNYLQRQQQLPNGGGAFTVAGASSRGTVNMPAFLPPVPPANPAPSRGRVNLPDALGPAAPGGAEQFLFDRNQSPAQSSGGSLFREEQEAQQAPPVDLYAKYRDPQTGEIMSPEDYAIFLGNRVPKAGGGDIGQYAGDALANPNESSENLMTRTREMNNTRNDIATGTTDPYKVGNQSDIAYSPQELKAIENAYAGIYDPAINDVFGRLKAREDESQEEARRLEKAEDRIADREDRIFSTNESIRRWRATTGIKGGSGSAKEKDVFSSAQINDGASAAKMSIEEFKTLDNDLKNYYVNPPTNYDENGDEYFISDMLAKLVVEIESGEVTAEEGANEIQNGKLQPSVKAFLINQLPASPEKKDGWVKRALNFFQ